VRRIGALLVLLLEVVLQRVQQRAVVLPLLRQQVEDVSSSSVRCGEL